MSKPIVGIKLTHDAGVACIDGDRLAFAVELEKRGNAPRYTHARTLDEILATMFERGLRLRDVEVVVDGWKYGDTGLPLSQRVAPYHEFDGDAISALLAPITVRMEPIGLVSSYAHLASHVIGSLLTAPSTYQRGPVYHIVWDGGIAPRLYVTDPVRLPRRAEFVAQLGKASGLLYSVMRYYGGPFADAAIRDAAQPPAPRLKAFGGRDKPGKLMSWIAFGKRNEVALEAVRWAYNKLAVPALAYEQTGLPEHEFMRSVLADCRAQGGAPDEDILLAVHEVLGEELVKGAVRMIPRGANLDGWNTPLALTERVALARDGPQPIHPEASHDPSHSRSQDGLPGAGR